MHSVKLSVDERDSVRSVGGMSESCAVLLLGIEFRVLIRAGWGEVFKSFVIVLMLLLTGEEKFERSRVALEESVVLLGDLCVAFGVGFGVDAWSGRGGLLMHVLLVSLLPMLSTEKEFERSIGVVLKRDDEKLGMPHWQHSQVMLLWV